MELKRYFVQVRYDDGQVAPMVLTAEEIIDIVGMADCSGDEVEVYDGSVFGELTKLEEESRISAPYNLHTFINPKTHEVEFEGYSPEH